MIAEKSTTARELIAGLGKNAAKVSYVNDTDLARALVYLEDRGFPNSKVEDYKYCNIDAILKKEFKQIDQKFSAVPDLKSCKLNDAVTMVVLNGTYSPELSDKMILRGVHLNTLSQLDAEGKKRLGSIVNVESDAFIALNIAFSADGFHLKVADGETLQMPLHIIYVNTPDHEAVVNSRNIIEVGKSAQATIIEHFINAGRGKVFANYLSERFVAENAKLNTFTLQEEGMRSYSVNTSQVEVQRNGSYDNTTVTMSGALVRNNHNVVLAGIESQAHLYGLFTSSGTQLVDNHTLMDHRVPRCESNELYKGIINDKSTGVFNGKIFVRRDAQKTNAYQSSKNILLSDDATINTKPQLEIYADDVKCSHGTSTGRIDENAMFYLNARGIGKESARKLLLASFAQEIISRIELDELRERISQSYENII